MFFHAEESNIICRSESIFEGTQESIVLGTNSLEKENDINEMFERLWSRDTPILGYMSDEDDRFSELFCDLHTHLCHNSYLRDTSRTSLDRWR